jgi:hypothetical protein
MTFNDAVASVTTLLINDGTFTAASTARDDLFGTLTINFTDPDARVDLDGSGESGIVNVSVNDTLEINGPLSDKFNGTLNLSQGSSIRVSAPWQAGNGSTINVNTVGSTGDSTLQVGGTFIFENGSATTLNGNLRLDNPTTIVQPGADFTGSGALINRPTRALQLLDGVVSGDLNVLIQNEGVLQLGAVNSDAQVGGAHFQQPASGTLQIEIGGTASNAFDQFNLTGAAVLSGELNLSLISGFVPALGLAFNILTASAAISGTFTTVSQHAGMPAGTAFYVS